MSYILPLPTTKPSHFSRGSPSTPRMTAASIRGASNSASADNIKINTGGFEKFLSEPSGKFRTMQLPKATTSRARLGGCLKEQNSANSKQNQANLLPGKPSGKLPLRIDTTPILRAVQDYLPYLVAIIQAIEHDSLLIRSVPYFAWRWKYLRDPKTRTVELSSLHYDLSASLWILAASLANSATSIIINVGSYEHSIQTTESDRKRLDEKVNLAADILCKSAGVLEYLSNSQIPRWEEELKTNKKSSYTVQSDTWHRPPELSSELCLALSKIHLADAERLAIRRLKSKAAAHSALVPGEPLPPSHPSPSLLAKLYLQVYALYDEGLSLILTITPPSKAKAAFQSLRSVSSVSIGTKAISALKFKNKFRRDKKKKTGQHDEKSRRRGGGGGGGSSENDLDNDYFSDSDLDEDDFSSTRTTDDDTGSLGLPTKFEGKHADSLRTYIQRGRILSLAMAYQWLGVDAAESSSSSSNQFSSVGDIGKAVGWLRLAVSLLSTVNDPGASTASSSSSKKKQKSKDENALSSSSSSNSVDSVLLEEKNRMKSFLAQYEQLNDKFAYQPVPNSEELLSQVPSGRSALAVKSYALPKPAFSPGRTSPEADDDNIDKQDVGFDSSQFANLGISNEENYGNSEDEDSLSSDDQDATLNDIYAFSKPNNSTEDRVGYF